MFLGLNRSIVLPIVLPTPKGRPVSAPKMPPVNLPPNPGLTSPTCSSSLKYSNPG